MTMMMMMMMTVMMMMTTTMRKIIKLLPNDFQQCIKTVDNDTICCGFTVNRTGVEKYEKASSR